MDDDKITISSVADFQYCQRRWYLHQIENQTCENAYMVEGKIQHEQVHRPSINIQDDKTILTDFLVYHRTLHLQGLCDVVELIKDDDGIFFPFTNCSIKIKPVEYKHGKTGLRQCDVVQVTAQAMCLEDMYNCEIEEGAVYYVGSDELINFEITKKERNLVTEIVQHIASYDGSVIKPKFSSKCKGCAMNEVCNPRNINIADYMKLLWESKI